MDKSTKEIFRGVYNLLDSFTNMDNFKAGAKEVCSKCKTIEDTMLAVDMTRAIADHITRLEEKEKRSD